MTVPRKTVFDAEMALAAKGVGGAESLAFGRKDAAERGPAIEIPGDLDRYSNVKLLIRPGTAEKAERWVKDTGGNVVSAGAEVVVADVPIFSLKSLEREDFVQRVEAPRSLQTSLDVARGTVTGLDAAVDRDSLTGAGVVLGVIDTGVDWRHPDFRDASREKKTRIEYFLHAHRPNHAQVSKYDEYASNEINAALLNHGQMPEGDTEGHGTHCASIAAGNGQASNGRFRGVAPNASIMAVRSEPLLDAHIIRGIREIFARAGKRPAVVNLSLGGHLGPHDGTSAIENVIARESGPGRIVVAAGGNEGRGAIHWSGQLEPRIELKIPFVAVRADVQWVDVWIPRGDEVDIGIETPDGVTYPPDGEWADTVFGRHTASFVEDSVNRDQNLTVLLAAQSGGHQWQVRLRPKVVRHGEVHAWSGTRGGGAEIFFPTGDNAFSIGMPATEERAISVASFVSKNTWETTEGIQEAAGLSEGALSPFSSRGPTRYGHMKPDVAAPGQYVTAALASGSRMKNDPRYSPRSDPTGKYITIQGTSMSAPFVAGVVALLLEREPRLSPEEIQQRLRVTARRDGHTGRVWNARFGYGKIDVEALLDYR